MFNNSRSHSSGGCYLTTIMCQILNYADDNYYLQTLRNFRDNVLKQDVKYYPLLLTYDVIGPMIAYHLSQDKDKEIIAKTMFEKYIIPSVNAIEENKTSIATNIYVAMTNVLAEKYNINTKIITIEPHTIDINTLGHGKVRKRTLTENPA
jgi:actin-related protein